MGYVYEPRLIKEFQHQTKQEVRVKIQRALRNQQSKPLCPSLESKMNDNKMKGDISRRYFEGKLQNVIRK